MTSYAVLGPGGVGGLLAAALASHGHEVTCVARDETAMQLQESGIKVSSGLFGDFTASVTAVSHLDHRVDVCFVAVKATALTASLNRIPPERIGDTLIVPLLNGVDHMELLRRRYAPQQVLAGVIHVESARVAPGVIEHGSSFARVSLGDAADEAGRSDRVAADLTAAGFEVVKGVDETTILWTKLAFLATAALLTAGHRATMGQVRTRHRDELEAVAHEVAQVSGACGGPDTPERTLETFDAFAPEGKTSMLRDLEAGRPLELDAIGGAVLRAAERHGIPVPTVRGLVESLREQSGADH